MYIRSLVFSAILANLGLGAPAEPSQPQKPEDWSLLGFRRVCEQELGRCTYSFLISEDPAKAPKYCDFAVDAAGGLPAYQTDFSSLKCPGAPEYTINGGWDEREFITLTVINDERQLLSFFAYKDADLWAGNEASPQTSKVFLYPLSSKRDIETREEPSGLAYATDWKILNLVRYEFNRGAPYTDAIIISFGIQAGDAPVEMCRLIIPMFEGTKPLGKSFAYEECMSGGWTASWGHNETTGEAVMTLMNPNHDRAAFFGFNNVNTNTLLGDNGPNAVSVLF
ncbi:hypothetical protein BDP55DRAFT_731340 [Colletotrichum godetiae]|uniref:Uncharacterized protein n=1 Tax=Colletotrichum godetiae TaxID=1209918 RepID=A0AAJ0AEW0_9PEZI|nr:uncharacterized protein BDP55DRAFT_731340 [Colletotrichum godetiae]KAK1672585.1 hypothetical protein BDP55DRAFT_731340 [Colletotrichum godetiae]